MFEPPLSGFLPSFVKTGTALDIGCGRGRFMSLLLKKGYRVIGLDINFSRLKEALKFGDVLLADSHTLPFKDKSFDVVSMLLLLHHIENPQKALDEILRVVKDTGVFYITEVVEDNPLLRLLRNIYPSWEGDPVKSRFTMKELKQMLNNRFLLIEEDMSYGNFGWLFVIFVKRFRIFSNLTNLLCFMERQTDRVLKNRLSCAYRAILIKKKTSSTGL